ncbi:MAG: hypothetical protein LBD21_04945 [Tannerellaceae bacterium]|jgi:hypothetical protein|nr:hypothetical protein [Tannerellaceae bacterium]
MRAYLKEIILGTAVALILAFAVVAFIRLTGREQQGLSLSLAALVPADTEAILRINRPDLFRLMIISEPAAAEAFARKLPPVFIDLLRGVEMQAAQISIHPRGQIMYLQTGRATSAAERHLRREIFSPYGPQEHSAAGLRLWFFPAEAGSYFGYYVHNGVMVSSYSRRLLESVAALHTASPDSFPAAGISSRLADLDANAPANLLFDREGSAFPAGAHPSESWAGLDIFAGEGSLCCQVRLPDSSPSAIDSLASFLHDCIPGADWTLQLSGAGSQPSVTACFPKKAPSPKSVSGQ